DMPVPGLAGPARLERGVSPRRRAVHRRTRSARPTRRSHTHLLARVRALRRDALAEHRPVRHPEGDVLVHEPPVAVLAPVEEGVAGPDFAPVREAEGRAVVDHPADVALA